MRGPSLFAAILYAALSVAALVSANGSYLSAVTGGASKPQQNQHDTEGIPTNTGSNNPYLVALTGGKPQRDQLSGQNISSYPLRRSSSDQAVNRQTRHPSIGQNQGRSYSVERYGNSGGGRRNNGGGCSTNYQYDYLQLTLMWGPGFCATSPKHCTRPSENRMFTVHGMWPNRYQGYPEFCCFDNNFYYKEIEKLVPTLNQYWFSYFDKNSRGFWSHEWLKHGTCLRDNPKLQGEENFFGTTLDIVMRLPLLETLKKDNIVPGENKSYQSQAIVNSLRQVTGGKVVSIDCDLEAHQPIPLLTGLNVCFDKNLAFVDCPQSKSRCRRQVLFLDQ